MPTLLVLVLSLLLGPASVAHAQPSLSAWAGTWVNHNMALVVSPDGTAELEWRTWRWCTEPGVRPPCDRIDSDGIRGGGQASILFVGTEGSAAVGYVGETSQPSVVHFGQIVLVRRPFGLAWLQQGTEPASTLCGPDYEAEAPPEVKAQLPCGT